MNRIFLFIMVCCATPLFAQVSTNTELGPDRRGDSRLGYFQIAKPFEVSMSVNLWGEVFAQGIYIVPTATDIIQLISFSGGARESANLEEVMLYRVAKEGGQRTGRVVNILAIIEGKSPTFSLMPGDMVVVKRKPAGFSWTDAALVITTLATLTVLGLQIYTLSK
jgi:hypothetical protein